MHSVTCSLIPKFFKSVYDLNTLQSLNLEELEGLDLLPMVSTDFSNGFHPFARFLCYNYKKI